MKNRERIIWATGCGVLFAACALIWLVPRVRWSAAQSKELVTVQHIAGRVCIYAEGNEQKLPTHLSELFPDYLQLGVEDRGLICEISGNGAVESSAQRLPTLLRYSIVAGDKKAIVHQVPDSNPYRDMVWQRLQKTNDQWALEGMADRGSYSELVTVVSQLYKPGFYR